MSGEVDLISKDFLEEIFKQEVDNFTCYVGTKPGDNYLSCVYRVKVTLKNGKVENLFVKCYPDNISTRQFLDSVNIFATEYWVYDKFLPDLNKLAEEASIAVGNLKAFVNTAKFYGGNVVNDQMAKFSKWNAENFIILEDLRPQGFRMLRRTQGLDLDHCLLTINQLANIHALSWVHKKRNGLEKLVDKYPYLHDSMYLKANEPSWRTIVENLNKHGLNAVRERFGVESEIYLRLKHLFSLDVLEFTRKFMSSSGFCEGEMENLLRIKSSSPIPYSNDSWLVATHGDCWINNLIFSYKDGLPSRIVLVDHQAFREACLTTDLAYFIYSSTKPCVRQEYACILLQKYFDKFSEICKALGENPPLGFTFEVLERRWRRARMQALLMSMMFTAFIYKPSLMYDKADDLDEVNCENAKTEESRAISGDKSDDEWKMIWIETVLEEYKDGIL